MIRLAIADAGIVLVKSSAVKSGTVAFEPRFSRLRNDSGSAPTAAPAIATTS